MSTFGNTSDTNDAFFYNANAIGARESVLTEAGTITAMSAYVNTSGAGSFRLAVYDDDGAGGNPGTLLGVTGNIAFDTEGNKWYSGNLLVPYAALAGTYWLAVHLDANENLAQYYLGGSSWLYGGTATYTSGTPATFPAGSAAENNMCIYATYTPGGAAAAAHRLTTCGAGRA